VLPGERPHALTFQEQFLIKLKLIHLAGTEIRESFDRAPRFSQWCSTVEMLNDEKVVERQDELFFTQSRGVGTMYSLHLL
jgi:hypothetical protein